MARATLIHYEEGEGGARLFLCEKHGNRRANEKKRGKLAWWDKTFSYAGPEKCQDCAQEKE